MNLFLPVCLPTFTSMVYFANTCGAKSGDKSWATMLACDEAMDLVFGTGADAVLDDADDVTHRPLSEPAVDVEDARRLLQLLAVRGLGVGCTRFVGPVTGVVQGLQPVEPASRDRFGTSLDLTDRQTDR